MVRRTRAHDPATLNQEANGPVVADQLDGKNGWTIDQAGGLVAQGYTVEHTVKRTGFPTHVVESAARRRGWREQ